MSETRQPTFGGAFRSLMKDLKDISHEIRNAYVICPSRDDKYYREDIQKIEERIIEAVNKLPKYELFEHMHVRWSIYKFPHYWENLENLTSGWEEWRSLEKMYENSRGEWIAIRNWRSEKIILDNTHFGFTDSKPKGFEKDLEWTADYRVDSCLTAVTQNPHIDTDYKDTDYRGTDSKGTDSKGTDSKGTDFKGTDSKGTDSKGTDSKDTQDLTSSLDLPAPYTAVDVMSDNLQCYTFGNAYRTVMEWLEQLGKLTNLDDTGTESMTQDKFEDIRSIELKIVQIVRMLRHFPIFNDMAAGWCKSQTLFQHDWKKFIALCATWIEPEAESIDWRNWKEEHGKIEAIIREIGKAQPSGGWEKDFDWTGDFYARSDEAIARNNQIAVKAVQNPNKADPIHMTFGGAFRMLKKRFDRMYQSTESSIIRNHREEKWFWLRLGKLQTQIITTFKKVQDYPLFIHMVLGLFTDHGAFLDRWTLLGGLVSKWEADAKWEEMNHEWIGSAARIDKRDWHKDRRIMLLSLGRVFGAEPEGYQGEPNWSADYLPLSRLIRKDVFFD